jgi:hypothetical protein
LHWPEYWSDVALAMAMLAVAATFYFGADTIQSPQAVEVGPRAFPKACAVALAIAAAVLLFRSAVRLAAGGPGEAIEFPSPAIVAAAALVSCLVPLTIETVGFNIVIGLWIVVMSLLGGVRSRLLLIALCGGYLLFAKVVFQVLLKTPLP